MHRKDLAIFSFFEEVLFSFNHLSSDLLHPHHPYFLSRCDKGDIFRLNMVSAGLNQILTCTISRILTSDTDPSYQVLPSCGRALVPGQ